MYTEQWLDNQYLYGCHTVHHLISWNTHPCDQKFVFLRLLLESPPAVGCVVGSEQAVLEDCRVEADDLRGAVLTEELGEALVAVVRVHTQAASHHAPTVIRDQVVVEAHLPHRHRQGRGGQSGRHRARAMQGQSCL